MPSYQIFLDRETGGNGFDGPRRKETRSERVEASRPQDCPQIGDRMGFQFKRSGPMQYWTVIDVWEVSK